MIEWAIQGRLARSAHPEPDEVGPWLREAGDLGIRSIVCLLDDEQLGRYAGLPGGLLEAYRRAGFAVGHVPVKDLQDPPMAPSDLEAVWRLFTNMPSPILVHCWAGIDRTGAAVAYIQGRIESLR
ncbi:MAG TPA: tyrosine-protein phosphatase [Anaerolineales bacterium]|nr:tyrosine-protein phosphatase [Anaerolineales bacterium]